MKRIISLALALLMAAALFCASGAMTYAHAATGLPGATPQPDGETEAEDPADPYLGLWQFTGVLDGDEYTSLVDVEPHTYLYFLPNGALYAVKGSENAQEDGYLAYVITGENTLDLYEGEDAVPAAYDPKTGVMTVTAGSENDPYLTFMERVAEEPAPDVFSFMDRSDQEQKFYGYQIRSDDQVLDLVEFLAIVDEEPGDYYYLVLRPDGTGYAQFGSEALGGDILWTETAIIAVGNEDEPAPYTREYGHLLMDISGTVMDFAPAEEVEALVALKMAELKNQPAQIPAEMEGTWELTKCNAFGFELTPEQMGTEMTLIVNLNGTAVLYTDDQAPAGYRLVEKEENTWGLVSGGIELFELRYDGETLILDVMGMEMIFE